MGKIASDEDQRAAKAAFDFLLKFAPKGSAQFWTIVVGKKPIRLAPGALETKQWLAANIRHPSGVCVLVRDLQYTSHIAVETHVENVRPFPARAMAAVQAGPYLTFLWRLIHQLDARRAQALAGSAISAIGGHDTEFLFPLPGSIRHREVVALKRFEPASVSRPPQFASPDAAKKRTAAAKMDPKGRAVIESLRGFGIEARLVGSKVGPSVTVYEVEAASHIRASRVVGMASDLASRLGVDGVRVNTSTGSSSIAIELPNETREEVKFSNVVASAAFRTTDAEIPLALGKAINGSLVVADLQTMPHLMIAGTTGSGKSVGLQAMILSILATLTPAEIGFVMIDPKRLELTRYNGIPHLALPVVTDPEMAVPALERVRQEMLTRYEIMERYDVRKISEYNEGRYGEPMPYLAVVIDEMAQLVETAGPELMGIIQQIAQMGRAAGVHIIMAMQRPSVDVVTGTIKNCFPSRISFQVTSAIDSRTIIGEAGAEQLLGQGDMLLMVEGRKLQRIQGPNVTARDIRDAIQRARGQPGPANHVVGGGAALLRDRPQKQLALEARADLNPQKAETAEEQVERALKCGPLPTGRLLAESGVCRATLYRLRRARFVVATPQMNGGETLWQLPG
jgi:hypothetical protein